MKVRNYIVNKVEKRWLPDDMPIKQKLFNVIMLGAIVAAFFSFIVTLVSQAGVMSALFILAGDFAMIIVFELTNCSNHMQLGPVIMCIISCIFFPVIYFVGGGIESGMIHWFVLGILFSFLLLDGKVFAYVVFMQYVVYMGTILVSFEHPELVYHFISEKTKFIDVVQCASIVSLAIGFIMKYQTKLYRREKDINEKQKILLEQTMEEAKSANEAKSQFLANMSHEIRTPMNAINGIAQILQEENLCPEESEYINLIKDSADNLLDIINDLLDFSKIEAGKFEIIEEEYDFVLLVNNIVKLTRVQLLHKDVELIVRLDSPVPSKLIGDSGRIRQILVNVLNNAVKYTQHGTISLFVKWVEIDEKHGEFEIQISDTGIGIKKENLNSLFEAFTQVDLKKNHNIQGTGLGLAICRKLLDIMNGRINVESDYGKGSIFYILLPQRVANNTPSSCLNEEFAEQKHNSHHIGIKVPAARILVVDDNLVNLKVAEGLLNQFEIACDTTDSGSDAISKITNNEQYDIVFMDHMMPEMDGIETTKRIRELEDKKVIPKQIIIALTANTIHGVKKMFSAAGMDDFLPKPIQITELERILNYWLPDEKIQSFEQEREIKTTKNIDKQADSDFLAYLDKAGFDTDDGLMYFCNNMKMYRVVLDGFAKLNSIDKIKDAMEMCDMVNYTILVHGVKSGARSVGANKLSMMASQLEIAGDAGDMPYIENNHQEFLQLYEKLVEKVLIALNNEECATSLEKNDIDMKKFHHKDF